MIPDSSTEYSHARPATPRDSPWTVFLVFLRLGLTSFGGPVAHLGYFRDEFVTRRRWLSERAYADLVALCQFLPGPASSQVGMALGLSRAGHAGALAAWCGFTLPSAIALVAFAVGISGQGDTIDSGALHGLKVVAVAVVAQAVWGMGRTLCTDPPRITVMAIACGVALLLPGTWVQVAVIAVAAVAGLAWLPQAPAAAGDLADALPLTMRRRTGALLLGVFFALLAILPVAAATGTSHTLQLIDAFYRAGSLVFGGGHVVLPLLQAEVVPTGWVDEDAFLAGYGAAQAVPGPLFTFAAFLGAAATGQPSGWLGGLVCLVAIFVPAWLLVVGSLPFWETLRRDARMRSALAGVNAAVVGLLLAALYQPVWTSAVRTGADFALALAAFVALTAWKLPPWLVVAACGLAGWGMSAAG